MGDGQSDKKGQKDGGVEQLVFEELRDQVAVESVKGSAVLAGGEPQDEVLSKKVNNSTSERQPRKAKKRQKSSGVKRTPAKSKPKAADPSGVTRHSTKSAQIQPTKSGGKAKLDRRDSPTPDSNPTSVKSSSVVKSGSNAKAGGKSKPAKSGSSTSGGESKAEPARSTIDDSSPTLEEDVSVDSENWIDAILAVATENTSKRFEPDQNDDDKAKRDRAKRDRAKREKADRVKADQDKADRDGADRDGVDRDRAKREKADQVKADQDKADQDKADQDKADQDKADRDRADRHRAKREKADRDRAKREKADQVKADQNKADQDKADQDKADRDRAKREKADQVKADQDKADRDRAKREKADQVKADRSKADRTKVKQDADDQDRAKRQKADAPAKIAESSEPRRKLGSMFLVGVSGLVLLAGLSLLATVLLGANVDDDAPTVEEIFEPDVVRAGGEIEMIRACTDQGFVGALISQNDEPVEVRVVVEFVTAIGERLHQSQLSNVPVEPGESVEIELPLVPRLIDDDLRGQPFECIATAKVVTNS